MGPAWCLLTSVVVVCLSSAVHATEWINPAGGDFFEPGNWNGPVPTGSEPASHFGIGSTPYTVTGDSDADFGAIYLFGSDELNDVTYDFNGHAVSLFPTPETYSIRVATTDAPTRLTLLDGDYRAYAGLYLAAESGVASSAALTIGAGAFLLSDGPGFEPTTDVIGGVGVPGRAATLNVVNGGVYDASRPRLGLDPDTHGVINIDGPGSQLIAYRPGKTNDFDYGIAVGLEGRGELNITNGGLLKTQMLSIAATFSELTGIGQGSVHVDHGAIVHEAIFADGPGTYVDIGNGGGHGSLTLTNQSTFSTDYLVIAGGSGDDADVVVDGGSTWTSSQVRLGEHLGSTGSLEVDGAGTTMVASFGSIVGYRGAGEFRVTGGATARFVPEAGSPGTGYLSLGREGAASSGMMVVDGAGSAVSIEGAIASALSVGRDGSGSLTVSDGGLVTTAPGGDIAIGRTATAVGVATVTGAGSILRGHAGIAVGGTQAAAGNSGVLNITGSGSIETTNLVVYAGDSVNLYSGGFGTIGAIGTVVDTPNTLTVRTGGTLRGVGTINGHVANTSGGALSPGISPGKLTINGNLDHGNCTPGAGGTLNFEIASAGLAGVAYDTLQVSGDALLGGTLNLVVAGSYVPNGANQFNIITGSDNIVGAFESITNRVITAGVGGRVWGDYKENNAGPGADRYYVAPRRQADFNGIGGVSGADYTIWADNFGKTWATFGEGDANGDRQVTGADYTIWADNFGQTSIGADLLPVSTYGYGVDEMAADSAPTVAEVNDIALLAAGDREILSGYGGFNGSANPVPEPSTVLMGGLALAGLVVAGRRRAGKSAGA